ncbi:MULTISPECIES: hypothetical protein [Burkholderia cepacia complex]|uniref:hypothetical protein n=1 Tax=Burkholderia cepacia complex TaxID=87882 RepID=UPI0012699458|nr:MULTISPECIES: hypothetical protein [Burkholderia cepacia complex]UTV54767.1 hypothetical protein NLX30_18085 [Burkholderia arboris]
MDCVATAVPYADSIEAFAGTGYTQDVPLLPRHLRYVMVQLPGAHVKAWEIKERDSVSVMQFLDVGESLATAADDEIESDVSAFAVASTPSVDSDDDNQFTYRHIHLKQVFSVQATYKHVGRLKPRKFSFDE